MDLLTLVLGIVLAVYGAQLLVDGGVAVARRFNIPTLVIGSTVVAFGTSMPELTVNVQSAMHGNTDLAPGQYPREQRVHHRGAEKERGYGGWQRAGLEHLQHNLHPGRDA